MDLLNEDLLKESVFDKSILKCVFMAGGPGSGKSYVAQELFGIPTKIAVTTKYDMKLVNSDAEFEHLLSKYGLETAGWQTLDIDQWPEEVYQMATGQTSSGEKADLDHMSIRDKAKGLTKKRLKNYTDGRLGVIIDGTGHNFGRIAKQKGEIEKLGYDTYMVAVNTSLDVAKERNKDRVRELRGRGVGGGAFSGLGSGCGRGAGSPAGDDGGNDDELNYIRVFPSSGWDHTPMTGATMMTK